MKMSPHTVMCYFFRYFLEQSRFLSSLFTLLIMIVLLLSVFSQKKLTPSDDSERSFAQIPVALSHNVIEDESVKIQNLPSTEQMKQQKSKVDWDGNGSSLFNRGF